MKRTAIIILSVAVLLFAALWTYVESDLFAERIRPAVVGPLQEVLGPGATIGKVKATLLPLVLEVRDVAMPSSTRTEMIAVRKVRIYINPFPLLYRTLSISAVTVLEPRLYVARSSDGSVDLAGVISDMRRSIAERSSRSQTALRVRVRSLSIRNGSVMISDAPTGVRVDVDRIGLKIMLDQDLQKGSVQVTEANIGAAVPSYPPVRAQLQGSGSFDGGRLKIASIDLRNPKGFLTASGALDATPDGEVAMQLTMRTGAGLLERMAGVLKKKTEKRPAVISAKAKITGTLMRPIIEGRLDASYLSLGVLELERSSLTFSYRDGSLHATGKDWVLKRNARSLDVSTIDIDGTYRNGVVQIVGAHIASRDAEIHASGTIGVLQGYQVTISARSNGEGGVLSFLSGIDANGSAAANGTLTGRLADPRFDGTIAAGPVTVRGTRFDSFSSMLQYHQRTLSLIGATIRQDTSRYLLDGTILFEDTGTRYQAHLRIIRSDVVSIVALFYKHIPLELTASGEISFSGTSSSFTGKGHLDLAVGTAYGESFERGTIKAELNSSRIVFPTVDLEKGGGRIKGRGWIGFDGTYYAHIEGNGVKLDQIDHLRALPLSGMASFMVRSGGTFSRPVVRARAESSDLSVRRLSLGDATMALDLHDRKMTIVTHAGAGRDTGVSLHGIMDLHADYAWDLDGEFRMAHGNPADLADGMEFLSKMQVDTSGRIALQGRGFKGDTITGACIVPKFAISIGDYRIENGGEVTISLEKSAFIVRKLVLEGTGTNLSLSGSARPGVDMDLALDGDVHMSLLRLFLRDVEHGDGTAALRMSIREHWDNPDVEGNVTLRDGMIKIHDIPQRFTALNGMITYAKGRFVTDGLSTEMGGGRLAIAGSAQLKGTTLDEFSVRVNAEDITVRYPPGMTATLAGTLYYDGDPAAQTLSGEVSILKAKYEKRIEWKSMLLDVTRGITRKKKADAGWIGETQLNVHFKGSENILFDSNLGKIPLKIDMLFRGTVNQISVLGRVEAREGEVYFRKNVFKVIYASADMVDPHRLNPVLDVQAETRVREYKIQLAVSGTADRAVVTFLSDPPLSDSDILALLAVGRKGQELEGKEANVGMSEAASFATGKFQDLLESRARSLTGLDRFQVDPYINKSDTPVPRVTVGKEMVQNKLYLTYSSNVGGTTPEQNLRLEYILNRNMSLLGEYDELGQIGADLKIRFEFR